MRAWLERALRGERQVVFVTGEAGIGKTTLVNALLEHASAAAEGIWIARGQCLEQYGAGEAYLPVLDGLFAARPGAWTANGSWRCCASTRRRGCSNCRRSFPRPNERRSQTHVVGATRERMLREMAEAVEAMSAEALP